MYFLYFCVGIALGFQSNGWLDDNEITKIIACVTKDS